MKNYEIKYELGLQLKELAPPEGVTQNIAVGIEKRSRSCYNSYELKREPRACARWVFKPFEGVNVLQGAGSD